MSAFSLAISFASVFKSLYDSLRKIHSYEVPEFIVISIDDGSEDYLSWISESVR